MMHGTIAFNERKSQFKSECCKRMGIVPIFPTKNLYSMESILKFLMLLHGKHSKFLTHSGDTDISEMVKFFNFPTISFRRNFEI